jgi:hypothetical protein
MDDEGMIYNLELLCNQSVGRMRKAVGYMTPTDVALKPF